MFVRGWTKDDGDTASPPQTLFFLRETLNFVFKAFQLIGWGLHRIDCQIVLTDNKLKYLRSGSKANPVW